MKSFSKPLVKTLTNYVLTGMLLLAFMNINAQNSKVPPLVKSVVREGNIMESRSLTNGAQGLSHGNETLNRNTKNSIKNSIDSIGVTQQASSLPVSKKEPIKSVKNKVLTKGQLLPATTEPAEATFNINKDIKSSFPTVAESIPGKQGAVSSTAGWNTITTQTFESTFPSGGWTTYANSGFTDAYWNDVNNTSYLGSWSAWCANGGTQAISPLNGYYPNNMKSWMFYGPFDLSDATAGDLSFYLKNNSEANYDYFSYMVSINSINYHGWQTSGTSSTWENTILDFTDVPTLGNVCGNSQVYIGLLFTSDASNNSYSGAFVDNVIIKKYVPTESVNLTPFQPVAWDNKIILSTATGTNTSAATIYDNQTIYLDWAVLNNGTANISETFYSKLYIDGILQTTYTSSTGLPSASYIYVTDATIGPLSAGTHTFTIVADANNNISESNESDNEYTLTKTITVSASANLIPYQPVGWDDKIVLSTVTGTNSSASTIYDNQTIYLDWAALNNSSSPIVPTFYSKLYVDGILKATYNTNGLPGNNYTYISDAIFEPLSAGTHTFKIVVDASNNVAESNESDNEYTRTKTITVSASANLLPYQPTLWDDKIVLSTVTETNTSASTIYNNQTIYLDWAIRNEISSAITQPFSTNLYVDGILEATYSSSTGLSANAYGFIVDEIIGPLSAGTHTFKIVVDSNNDITESNESDNEYTRTKTIQVLSPADIHVSPVALTIYQSGESSAGTPSYVLVDNSKNNPIVPTMKGQAETTQHFRGNMIPDSVVEYWRHHESKSFAPNSSKALATTIDWSINDSPVKNQGTCGSCWAFAVTAYIENVGTQNDLSEQDLVSCADAGDCSGGFILEALQFFKSTGVPAESCYPYTQQNGSCSNLCAAPSFKERITTVSNYLWGLTSVENLKAKLQEGPLVVCMNVPEDNTFDYYTGGVYNYNGGSIDPSQGHTALLVGYDDNQQCFKVKNSWGSSWGENGYFRIAYNDVTDDVEFGSYAINGSGVYTENLSNSSFTISNQGMGDLSVSSISDNKNWLTTAGYPTTPIAISPSGSQNVSVNVDWSLMGSSSETALITIQSNDPDEASVTVQVTAVPRNCAQTPPTVESIIQPTCVVATGSVKLNGLPATGTWTLTRTPGGTTTTGTGTSITLSGLLNGTYTYTVTNSAGCTSGSSANVVINAQPSTPTAPLIGTITQPTPSIMTGSVVLSGLPATGSWILTRTPGGITTSGTGTSKTISGLSPGTYVYTVTNLSGCISLTSANILINNLQANPTANAGPDQSVNEGSFVSLNGSASTSSNGNPLTFKWTAPAGIILSSTSVVNPTFTAPQVSANTNYTFSLVVNNGTADSPADQLIITVNNSNLVQHFTPIWNGNGIDHMNINIYSAKLDGVELEASDEIGIFDGPICVGAGIFTRNVSPSNTLDIVVSRNDGSGNGYTPGNSITYKIFDKSKNLEFSNVSAVYSAIDPSWRVDGKFSMGSTAFAELTSNTKSNQNIVLNIGWNIISANLTPANLNLKDIFQPMIDAGKLKKVMDETGKTIEDFGAFGGWKNNIGNLNSTKGYKVNVSSATTLFLEGVPVALPLNISLNSGWNIISFPCTGLQDAKTLVQSLIDAGKLLKVMDESGKTIENFGAFGGWKNNIGNFIPGKGYKVNMNAASILNIPANVSKSAMARQELLASSHFKPVFQGNGTDHMNINLVNLQTSGWLAGDEVGVFDGQNCVGAATIGTEQLIDGSINIPVSANDELGTQTNGFIHGNPVTIQLFRNNQEYQLNLELLNKSTGLFAKGESMFVMANTGSTTGINEVLNPILVKCYPNPFTELLTIEIELQAANTLEVVVYDITGKLIQSLYQDKAEKYTKLVWNGKNGNGIKMIPGTYLLKINDRLEKIILK